LSTRLIRLPIERADQLNQLATHKGLSVSDLIGQLVTAEINRLGITHQIGLGSSVDCTMLEDGRVHFSAANIGTFQWSAEAVAGIVTAIEAALKRSGGTLDVDAGIEIGRVGTSIRLQNIETGEARTFAPSVAVELVNMLRATISASP